MTTTMATMTILMMTATVHYEDENDGNNDFDTGDDDDDDVRHVFAVSHHSHTKTQSYKDTKTPCAKPIKADLAHSAGAGN